MLGLSEGKALGDDIPDWDGELPFFTDYDGTDKSPSEAQLKAGKGVGEIQWSKTTGGPRHISGSLTPPSEEDPEIIAWRFLEEKKVLYGFNDPHEDLRIKVRIDDEYDTTIHFEQIYKGVPTDRGYLVVSLFPNGVIHSVSGEYYPGVEVDVEPKISAEEAWNKAKEHWEKYSYHNPSAEYQVQHCMTPSIAKLEIVLTTEKTYLMWFIEIFYWDFYIDAHRGIIRKSIEITGINPRILIQLNLLDLTPVDGNIEVTPQSLDFGIEEVDLTAAHQTQKLVISNTKEGSILVIRDVVLEGEAFTIEEPSLSLPLPIKTGEEAVIFISFSPSAEGEAPGILSIETTDKDNPVVEVLLTGGSVPAPTASQKEADNFNYHYGLSPYSQSWLTPFSLLYTPYTMNTNQVSLYPAWDYPFSWNWQYFNQGKENPASQFIFSSLYDFSNILSFSSTYNPAYYNDYYFPYYKHWE